MGYVAYFVRFPAVQKFENRLRFDKVTWSLNVGTVLRRSVFVMQTTCMGHAMCSANALPVIQ